MRILLTNDDGIDAPGLAALESALSARYEVWVCAPDGERSGFSHRIQLHGPLKIRNRGPQRFDCSGSPADCVFLAQNGKFVPPVDAVVSGINQGPNLGTDTLYSGTCAAARQAALFGLPALAVSHASLQGPWDFRTGAEHIAGRLEELLALAPPGHFVNLNLPETPVLPLEIREATLVVRKYHDRLVTFTDPSGDLWCWADGLLQPETPGSGTDADWTSRGVVSWTALPAEPASTCVGAKP